MNAELTDPFDEEATRAITEDVWMEQLRGKTLTMQLSVSCETLVALARAWNDWWNAQDWDDNDLRHMALALRSILAVLCSGMQHNVEFDMDFLKGIPVWPCCGVGGQGHQEEAA